MLRRIVVKVQHQINSPELFAIDCKLMKTFGYWPSDNLYNWKMVSIYLFMIVFDLIPKLNYLRSSIINREVRSIALSVPECLTNITTILIIPNFVYHGKVLKHLIEKLEIGWKKSFSHENPEWQKIRTNTTKASNKITLMFRLSIFISAVLYNFGPFLIFIIQYHFLGMKIEKFTVTLVE